jgi:hypothetical protein
MVRETSLACVFDIGMIEQTLKQRARALDGLEHQITLISSSSKRQSVYN